MSTDETKKSDQTTSNSESPKGDELCVTERSPEHFASLAPEAFAQIDRICDDFEAEWRLGKSPNIAEFVESIEPGEYNEAFHAALGFELARLHAELQAKLLGHHSSACDRTAGHSTLAETRKYQEKQLLKGQPIGKYQVERFLAQGGFGVVYLARHPVLETPVAIKLARFDRFKDSNDAERFLEDARQAASLNHPGIVTIHDVDQHEQLPFIVQEYLPGGDLGKAMSARKYSYDEIVRFMIKLAEAVDFAHSRGIFHRDIKPANILLDAEGTPRLADFGLAIRERSQKFMPADRSGTPPYMAPEQVRGESNRIDGRCDVWALGVVIYEWLTGARPFESESTSKLFEKILSEDPLPLRRRVPAIPEELQRIGLQCLSKEPRARYRTAASLAEDLQHWLDSQSKIHSSTSELVNQKPPSVVPKFLRSFDSSDQDFFLQLLPGPHDQSGMPASIQNWKKTIEERDSDNTFPIGLIYGPSGCGKSSIVRAGLLPALSEDVLPIYVEATRDETEIRLLKSIRKVLPDLPTDWSLPEMIECLREDDLRPSGKKLLLIIDQFEQWLHSHTSLEGSQFVEAMRHCDGSNVQALFMVRDDFWMAVTRFLNRIEVGLVEGSNLFSVDRFDLKHAKRVLKLFGQAYSALPSVVSPEEEKFLEIAVSSLSEDDRVVSVRLSMFAHLMRHKRWVPSTLEHVGGAQGIGVAFLDEAFSSQASNPKHRVLEPQVEQVLGELLPATGLTIRGRMQSVDQLVDQLGCDETTVRGVLNILESELGLITPTDPIGILAEKNDTSVASLTSADTVEDPSDSQPSQSDQSAPDQYFQLTHDFLVPTIRTWLSRRQKSTRKGRAQLQLQELANAWEEKPESRRLPGLFEWVNILFWVRSAEFSTIQKRMMGIATRRYSLFGLASILILGLLYSIGWNVAGYVSTRELAAQIESADYSQVPELRLRLQENPAARTQLASRWEQLASVQDSAKSRERLMLALALAPEKAGPTSFLSENLDEIPLDLVPYAVGLIKEIPSKYQGRLTADDSTQEQVLRSAAYLASIGSSSKSHLGRKSNAERVVESLANCPAVQLADWINLLEPASEELTEAIHAAFSENKNESTQQSQLAEVASIFWRNGLDNLCRAVGHATPKQLPILLAALQRHEPNADEAVRLLELDRQREPTSLEEPPFEERWRETIKASSGHCTSNGGFALNLSWTNFKDLEKQLKEKGFGLQCFRPFWRAQELRVATAWSKSSATWTTTSVGENFLPIESIEFSDQHKNKAKNGFRLIDLCYVQDQPNTEEPLLAALWIKESKFDREREQQKLEVGLSYPEREVQIRSANKLGYEIVREAMYTTNDGHPEFTILFEKVERQFIAENDQIGFSTSRHASDFGDLSPGRTQADIQQFIHQTGQPHLYQTLRLIERLRNDIAESPTTTDKRNLAQLLVRIGSLQEAADLITGLIDANPKDALLLDLSAQCYAGLKDVKATQAAIAKFLKRVPRKDYEYLMGCRLGICRENSKDAQEAFEKLKAYVDERASSSTNKPLLIASSIVFKYFSEKDPEKAIPYKAILQEECKELVKQPKWLADFSREPDYSGVRLLPCYDDAIREANWRISLLGTWRDQTKFETRQIACASDSTALKWAIGMVGRGFSISVLDSCWDEHTQSLLCSGISRRQVVSPNEQFASANQIVLHAIALASLGKNEQLRSVLAGTQGATARSLLIDLLLQKVWDGHRLLDTELKRIFATSGEATTEEADSHEVSLQAAAYIQLASAYRPVELDEQTVKLILNLARDEDNPAIRSSALWTAKNWGRSVEPAERFVVARDGLSSAKFRDTLNWYVNSVGNTMIAISKPNLDPESSSGIRFKMGSPQWETQRGTSESQYWISIDRSFSMAANETTIEQFESFLRDPRVSKYYGDYAPSFTKRYVNGRDCPQISVNWMDVVLYCQWLTEKEGFSEADYCFPSIWKFDRTKWFKESFVIPTNYLQRRGYRPPTEAEWEYSYRAGVQDEYPFGVSGELALQRGWLLMQGSSQNNHVNPIELKLPNRFGLFGMVGNVKEWCVDSTPFADYLMPGDGELRKDTGSNRKDLRDDKVIVSPRTHRAIRGGGFEDVPRNARSAERSREWPDFKRYDTGFRIARTLARKNSHE